MRKINNLSPKGPCEATIRHGKLKANRKAKHEEVIKDDLAGLDVLTEETIIDNLRNRYRRQSL